MKKQLVQPLPNKEPPERDSKLKAIMSVTEEDSQFVLNLAKTIFGENFSTNKPISFYNTFANKSNQAIKSPGKLPQLNEGNSKKPMKVHTHTLSTSSHPQNSKYTPNNQGGVSLIARNTNELNNDYGFRSEPELQNLQNKGYFRESLYGQNNPAGHEHIQEFIDIDSPRQKDLRENYGSAKFIHHNREPSYERNQNNGSDESFSPTMKINKKFNSKKGKKEFTFASFRFSSEKPDQEELYRWLEFETRKAMDSKGYNDTEKCELVEEVHKVAMELYFKIANKEQNPYVKFAHRIWSENRKCINDHVSFYQRMIQNMEERVKQELANLNYEKDRKFEINDKITEHYKRDNEELQERITRYKEHQNELNKKLQEKEREVEEYEIEKQFKEQEKRKRQILKAKAREKITSASVATDTKGLNKVSDMFTQMTAYEFKTSKESQTDLQDIIHLFENETLSPLKKERKQKDRRIMQKILEIDKIGGQSIGGVETVETLVPDPVVDWNSFKTEFKQEERLPLSGDYFNTEDWTQPLNNLIDKFSEKMFKFLHSLEVSLENLNTTLQGAELNMTKLMYEELLKNRTIFRDFSSIFNCRISDVIKEIMQLRIEKAEHQLKENDKNKILDNLEKKFKKLNEKFKQLQEAYLFEESISGKSSLVADLSTKIKGSLFAHKEEEEDEVESPDSERPTSKLGKKEKIKDEKPRRQSMMKLQNTVKQIQNEVTKSNDSSLAGRGFLRGNTLAMEENKSKPIDNNNNKKQKASQGPPTINLNKYKRRESLQINPSLNGLMSQGEPKSTSSYLNEILYAKESDLNILLSTQDFLSKKTKIVTNFEIENHREIFKSFHKIKSLPITPSPEFKSDVLGKVIATIYTENLKGDNAGIRAQVPLCIYLWEYISNRYGNFSKGVETKILAILRSCLYYKSIPRIRLFYKLLGMYQEPYEYDEKEFQIYLQILQALDEPSAQYPGLAIAMIQTEKALVPLKSVIDYFQQVYKMDSEGQETVNLEYYLTNIREQKEPHPMAKALLVVDVDFVAEKILEMKYEIDKNLYKNVFGSAQTNNCLELDGFLLLCRTIETKRFRLKSSLKAFAEYADLIDDDSGKKMLSFRSFCSFSKNQNYFSPKKINAFMSLNFDNNKVNLMGREEFLKKEWNLKKDVIKLKYLKGRMFSSYLMESAKSIDLFLSALDQKRKDYDLNSVFMRFVLLHYDSETIFLDLELESLLPSELLMFKSIWNKI